MADGADYIEACTRSLINSTCLDVVGLTGVPHQETGASMSGNGIIDL